MVTISEVLSKGFNTCISHIRFVLLIALMLGLVSAIAGSSMHVLFPHLLNIDEVTFEGVSSMEDFLAIMGSIFTPELIVYLISISIFTAFLYYFAIGAYLIHFEKKEVGESFKLSLSRFLLVWITGVLTGLISVVLFMFFIIPGIIFMIFALFAIPAVALRNKNPISAISYSFTLIQNNWFRSLGYGLVIVLVLIGVSIVLGIFETIFGYIALLVPEIAGVFISGFVETFFQLFITALSYAFLYQYMIGLEEEKNISSK